MFLRLAVTCYSRVGCCMGGSFFYLLVVNQPVEKYRENGHLWLLLDSFVSEKKRFCLALRKEIFVNMSSSCRRSLVIPMGNFLRMWAHWMELASKHPCNPDSQNHSNIKIIEQAVSTVTFSDLRRCALSKSLILVISPWPSGMFAMVLGHLAQPIVIGSFGRHLLQ